MYSMTLHLNQKQILCHQSDDKRCACFGIVSNAFAFDLLMYKACDTDA